jgi:hypothetical protein
MGLGGDEKGNKAGMDFGGEDGSEEEGEGLFDGAGDEKQENALDTGIIINFDDIEEIMVTKKHKKLESAERNVKIVIKQEELKEYMKKMIKMPETEKKKKDTIKIHMIDIRDAVEYLQQEEMNEQKFWGLLALNDEEVFDYGRDILKEGTYETIMKLPYTQFPLFTKSDWFKDSIQKPISQVQGILRSGNLSGSSIKGKIQLINQEEEEEGEGDGSDKESGSEATGTQADEKTKPEDKKPKKKENALEGNENRSEKINKICESIAEEFPFDIMEEIMLKALHADIQTYKVRVYLISA